jgi:hypothetical protein
MLVLGTITRLFSTRRGLVLENLALRQQLLVFKRRHRKPRLSLFDLTGQYALIIR